MTIKNTTIKRHWYAILLSGSSSNNVSGNSITDCGSILLNGSSNYNTVYGNNIANNYYSILLDKSSNNKFYRNNFINSTVQQVYFRVSGYANVWDDGYPSGGNYWSDCSGVDAKSGSGQDQLLGDGMGDTAYVIDTNNTDSYPLMAPTSTFKAGTWNGVTYYVDISSNSAISNFAFSQENKQISFNVTGADGTGLFSRVVIPKQLLWVENGWIVFVDWTQVGPLVTEDANYTYLYFTYGLSTKTVIIRGTDAVPEFSSFFLILPLFMIATLLTVIAYRRKHTITID